MECATNAIFKIEMESGHTRILSTKMLDCYEIQDLVDVWH